MTRESMDRESVHTCTNSLSSDPWTEIHIRFVFMLHAVLDGNYLYCDINTGVLC